MESTLSQLRPIPLKPLAVRWLHYLLPLALAGVAVHLLLPQLGDLEHTWKVVQTMPRWAVAMAIFAQVISYFGSGYLLSSLGRILGQRLSLARAVAISMAGSSMGLVAGGVVGNSTATYRWVRASGGSGQFAGLSGTMPSVINNVLLVVAALMGLLHLLIIHQLTRLEALSFGIILSGMILLLGGVAWGISRPKDLTRVGLGLSRRWAAFRKRESDPTAVAFRVNGLLNSWTILKAGWRRPAAGALVSLAGDMFTLYFMFVAAGNTVSPGVLLTGYGLPLLLGRVGFLPGGVGIVEATMTSIYHSLGIANPVIVVVILGYRLISFWLPTLLGFPLIAVLGRQDGQKV